MTCDTRSVVDWLLSGARSAPESHQVLAETCERLCACGIPLWRVDVFVRTLHPDITGRRFRWQVDTNVSISSATYDLAAAEPRKSLLEKVCSDGVAIRRRLSDPECEKEFPLLLELHEEGVTDLLASPLIFTDGDDLKLLLILSQGLRRCVRSAARLLIYLILTVDTGLENEYSPDRFDVGILRS